MVIILEIVAIGIAIAVLIEIIKENKKENKKKNKKIIYEVSYYDRNNHMEYTKKYFSTEKKAIKFLNSIDIHDDYWYYIRGIKVK